MRTDSSQRPNSIDYFKKNMDAVMIRHAAQAEQLGAYDSLIILKARRRNTSADVVCIAQRYRVG